MKLERVHVLCMNEVFVHINIWLIANARRKNLGVQNCSKVKINLIFGILRLDV